MPERKKLMGDFSRQKVLINQIVVFALTALTYAGAKMFGVDDIPGMAEGITLAVMGVLEVAGGVVTHRQVTPISDPKNNDGIPLIPDPHVLLIPKT